MLKIISLVLLNIIAPALYGSNDILFSCQDTLKNAQVLYNGRIWRNLYSKIRGDQFLFSPELTTGTVSMAGRRFVNVPLRYDIYSDELLTETPHGLQLQLNKEMVDSFSLEHLGKDYYFVKSDSAEAYSGYINLLYKGKSTFAVKYRKNVELLAVDKKYDEFYLVQKLYLVRDNSIDQFSGRLELMKLFGQHKKAVRSYMKKSRIMVSKKYPESFIPVIEYYDSIR